MSEANAPDKSLLRWQESDLYEAEEKVLEYFREGWKADGRPMEFVNGQMTVVPFVVPPEGSSIPEKPAEVHIKDDWQGAILRAEFLRDLFLGNYGKFDPRQIVISRAWIEGPLNLNYCESSLPLLFSRCIFSGEISLLNAIIPELLLSGCEIRRSLFAQGAKMGANVILDDGFKSAGMVNLHGAEIAGQLACDGYLKEGLNAEGLKAGRNVFLRKDFVSIGEVNLVGAEIVGQLDCDGGHFGGGLTAQNLKAGTDVLLGNDFKSVGLVHLFGADIGRRLACGGGHFDKGLIAQNLKAGAGVILNNDFESADVVDLLGADIGGDLDCCGGHFQKGLFAASLKTGGVVFLSDGFVSADEVNLHGAEIGGWLACNGGHFKKGLNAVDLKTSADVLLKDGFRSDGAVNLFGAEIGKDLDCSGGHFDGGLVLSNAEVRGLRLDDLQERPLIGFADGFRYQAIEFASDDLDWKKGLDWVEAMTKLSNFSPQPYEQLMSVYRRMGHTNWARNVGFALEEKRSKEFKGWQWLTWRPWYGILRSTIGYGYKPFRFFSWAVGLMTAGFLLFSSGHEGIVSRSAPPSWQAPAFLANEWIPSEVEALESESWTQNRKPPKDYLPFNPLVYSLEVTFPVLSLGQLEKWHPSNKFLLRVRWAWTLIGTLLLAILALFGAGVLGPRWRSGDEGG